MKTAIVWFRNDLRIHDNPALHKAVQTHDAVLPVFILTPEILHSKRSSPNRNRFLQQCLEDLQRTLRKLGGDLLVTQGSPEKVLTQLSHEYDAKSVFYASDHTPFAIKRDQVVGAALAAVNVAVHQTPGRTIVSNLAELRTKTGNIYKVFTPFYKTWLRQNRRTLTPTPQRITLPPNFQASQEINSYDSHGTDLSPNVLIGGETSARIRLESFLRTSVANYEKLHNDLAADATSRLSAYFHFGCISPLEAESILPDSDGARSWQRQLAWRDFYMYILYHFPDTLQHSFQEPFVNLKWTSNHAYLEAWKTGQTGYPLVDAAMRQLRAEGFMHNRARLLVGSFFTKDLWLDWRLGEAYFMQWLIDGDTANNVGNWQWIASIGVDPAPVFRRLYNPTLQQKTYDPTGAYIKRYVPELARVPTEYIAEPWKMPPELQTKIGCVVGVDYPKPIVDHATARKAALEQYRSAK